jgi:aminoglycoside phosphotransferase (APT) family kinase protein
MSDSETSPLEDLEAELAPVRPGEELDWVALERYLRAEFQRLDPPIVFDPAPMEVLQFPNGAANLTYLLRFAGSSSDDAAGTELVLRRPPFGRVAPGAHDMKREYRVLSKLWKHLSTAPRAYLLCEDHAVVGSDFVVMERRTGVVVRSTIPAAMQVHENVGRRMGFALVDAMADLHLVDPAAAGLEDLGKPAGFAERQVTGWRTRWELVRPQDASPTDAIGLMDEIPQRLLESLPNPSRPSLVHNDLKLDNCQFHLDDPDRVRSIFDWDMTTLGEPLVDLGTLLNYWPDPSDGPEARRVSHEGMAQMGLPTRAEVVQRYHERTGIDVSAARWYEAFAQWKTAVVIQQLHDRWRRGESTDPRMEFIADRLPQLAHSAEELLGP